MSNSNLMNTIRKMIKETYSDIYISLRWHPLNIHSTINQLIFTEFLKSLGRH
jgi:hypothetical protein